MITYNIVYGDYTHIKSVIKYPNNINDISNDYNSKVNPLDKTKLKEYLNILQLL